MQHYTRWLLNLLGGYITHKVNSNQHVLILIGTSRFPCGQQVSVSYPHKLELHHYWSFTTHEESYLEKQQYRVVFVYNLKTYHSRDFCDRSLQFNLKELSAGLYKCQDQLLASLLCTCAATCICKNVLIQTQLMPRHNKIAITPHQMRNSSF